MLNNALYRFNILDIDRLALVVEEIAQEYRTFLAVNQRSVFFEQLIVALARCQLQGCNGLRIPSVLDTIFAPMKQTIQRSKVAGSMIFISLAESNIVQSNGIVSDSL